MLDARLEMIACIVVATRFPAELPATKLVMGLVTFFQRRSKFILAGVVLVLFAVLLPELPFEVKVRAEPLPPAGLDLTVFLELGWRQFVRVAGMACIVVGCWRDSNRDGRGTGPS
jgi:hypothetical protein